jgi:hypothetical protein
MVFATQECPKCHGKKFVNYIECVRCGGSGEINAIDPDFDHTKCYYWCGNPYCDSAPDNRPGLHFPINDDDDFEDLEEED